MEAAPGSPVVDEEDNPLSRVPSTEHANQSQAEGTVIELTEVRATTADHGAPIARSASTEGDSEELEPTHAFSPIVTVETPAAIDTPAAAATADAQPSASETDARRKVTVLAWVCAALAAYGRKFRGAKKTRPPLAGLQEGWWTLLGCFVGIAAVASLHYNVLDGLARSDLALLIASYGATAVLLYGVPTAPLAQPRNVIFGHTASAIVGVAVRKLIVNMGFQSSATWLWLGAAAAVSLSTTLMVMTSTSHPPGGATALVAVVGEQKLLDLGFMYVLMPTLTGAVIMVLVALVLNNAAPNRIYPQFWW